ncbi:hypothetical protein AURDEDRAFT_171835 [Auricularia subglabra TFB-10046 SS5]|uniref:Uncharacterized protein n=1 Tax=Auricularia subglabra (strain TFB-10046 / SS5) TaxID=717982 RepID=J0WVJ8_AURST|nr:hypothetical protein AURDEDRAFT_171835 [Auricularia subglabra TFB-10046 SS5]
MTTDTRALMHILFATHVFHKPEIRRRGLKSILGEGLLWSEGEQHRDQVLHAFLSVGLLTLHSAHVRDMTEIFVEKAAKNMCIEAGGSVRLNAIEWLSKATLASIGKAGFDYDFDTLNEHAPKNELAEAFDKVFRADESPGVILRVLLKSVLQRLPVDV